MRIFAHPDEVCMSYTQHCKLSLKLCLLMLLGCIKAFIHAFIPDLFITSTSDINKKISIDIPKNYFPNDDFGQDPINSWTENAILFFDKWFEKD